MGFNILRYEHKGTAAWGVQKDDHVIPFAQDVAELKTILVEEHLAAATQLAENEGPGSISMSDINILSPVTRPTRLLALGVNYHDHREEAGSDQHAEETLFFRKDDSAINTPTGDIVRPGTEPLLDYEVEMGLVIKKGITAPIEITPNNIGEYVAGMVLVNDMSARVTMIGAPFSQWYKGKSGRTMCPIGPYIHIFGEGEAAQMHEMEIKLWVNDELRQDAHTRDLIAKPEAALTEASGFVDLAPGDVLLTGTPGGVAIKAPSDLVMFISQFVPAKRRIKMLIDGQLKSGKFLNDGDVVRCTLQSADGSIDCGEQRNQVVSLN